MFDDIYQKNLIHTLAQSRIYWWINWCLFSKFGIELAYIVFAFLIFLLNLIIILFLDLQTCLTYKDWFIWRLI